MKKFFYSLLAKYLNFYINEDSVCVEINPKNDLLKKLINTKNYHYLENIYELKYSNLPQKIDFFIISGTLHYENDIQLFLEKVRDLCSPSSRIIVCYYSALWKPLFRLFSMIGIREKTPEPNWFSPDDLHNFAILSDLEIVHTHEKILFPLNIPIISFICNRILAPLPFFRLFTMLNIAVLKTNKNPYSSKNPSVSIIIPARNEEGNIFDIYNRIPLLCNDMEIIFVEGNSTDKTWEKILELKKNNPNIVAVKQEGIGKGDAVRKGFSLATKEILMILDADMSVPPEELSKFYKAIKEGKGEFINGSRLVYPLENKSMRFINILGNKFFAIAFTFVLQQRFKDTLCGTKVLSKENYQKIEKNRLYFGNFDPFGDFDLLFGATKIGLKIVEIPIHYKARIYGKTNIKRWKHGWLLFKMLIFACKKIKFI